MTKSELEVISEETIVLVSAHYLLKKYGCETIRGTLESIRDRVTADTDLDAVAVQEWDSLVTYILGVIK